MYKTYLNLRYTSDQVLVTPYFQYYAFNPYYIRSQYILACQGTYVRGSTEGEAESPVFATRKYFARKQLNA